MGIIIAESGVLSYHRDCHATLSQYNFKNRKVGFSPNLHSSDISVGSFIKSPTDQQILSSNIRSCRLLEDVKRVKLTLKLNDKTWVEDFRNRLESVRRRLSLIDSGGSLVLILSPIACLSAKG
jgi:hypothetical protein